MKRIRSLVLLVVAASLSQGCEDSSAVFVEHLAIININPSHGAVGIGYDADAAVTFSEVLKIASVNASTICLTADTAPPADPLNPCAGALPATVTYTVATLTARLTPGTALLPDTRYTLHVTSAIEGDQSGALPATVAASFRTIPTN